MKTALKLLLGVALGTVLGILLIFCLMKIAGSIVQ